MKKLVIVIMTSTSMIGANKKILQDKKDLDQVSYIYYSILFWFNIKKAKIMTLIDFKNKINTIKLTYAEKLYI